MLQFSPVSAQIGEDCHPLLAAEFVLFIWYCTVPLHPESVAVVAVTFIWLLEIAFTLLIVSGLGVGGLASMLKVVQLLQFPELLKVSFAFTLHEYEPVESAVGVQFVAVGVPV